MGQRNDEGDPTRRIAWTASWYSRRWLTVAALALALLAVSPASAATAHRGFPLLRAGAHGQRVKDAQWLLGGHRPSVYRYDFYPYPPDGQWGRLTTKAVLAMKWRLGYPLPAAHVATFGPDLYRFLTGAEKRPLEWIGRASRRIRRVRAQHPTRGSPCAVRVARVALQELALGVHEIPDGSNYSPRIALYESVTGAYRAAWCVSFAQYVYLASGVGTIANRSAGVFYVVAWAHDRGWLRSRPAVGAWVAYLRNLGHMGVVVRVTSTGFWTVEGNSGNAVREHWYPLGYASTVFVYPPCVR